jgi:hypothetical protein
MNSFDASNKIIYCVFVIHPSIIFTYPITKFCLQLFADHVTMFATLKGRKQCCVVGSLFRKATNVVTYLIYGLITIITVEEKGPYLTMHL